LAIPTIAANNKQPMTYYSHLVVTIVLSCLLFRETDDNIFGLKEVLAISAGHSATLTVGFDSQCEVFYQFIIETVAVVAPCFELGA